LASRRIEATEVTAGKSLYQIASSGPMASRRGRAAGSGNGYSRIAIVFESMVAIFGAPNSTKYTTFLELTAIP
jgi:hypothetical protein